MTTETRNWILGGIGLLGLVLYILACVSFSPDDSKVLYPSFDPKTVGMVMAMYDRSTRTSRALLTFPANDDGPLIRPFWTPDGSDAVALWREEHDEVLRIAGLVDTRSLALTPLFEASDLDDASVFAVSRDGTRLAVLSESENSRDPLISVFQNGRLLRKLPMDSETNGIDEIGTFEWSKDGNTLYCIYAKNLHKGDSHQFGIVEVRADGSAMRAIPLFSGDIGRFDEDIFVSQLDISHDGKTLALASTYHGGPDFKPEDLALYFIDLSRADRRITMVPIPLPPKPEPTKGKE